MRAGGHARVQGDPADVAAHDLGDHAAVVGVAGGAQPVHRLGGDLHGGVEAERVVGGGEVVVDGLGHADDLDAGVGEALGGRQGALAADRDDGVDARAGPCGLDALGPPPFSNGLVRDVPRIVPPCLEMPMTWCGEWR